MMDVERSLIAKIVSMRTGMKRAVESKITADFFTADQTKRAWQWCLEYWQEYGEAPTEKAFRKNYPAFKLPEVVEPFDFVVGQLKETRRRYLLIEVIQEALELIDTEEPVGSPTLDAIRIIQNGFSKIEIDVTSTRDTNISETVDARLERYEKMSRNKGKLLGIPTGYRGIDLLTGGFQPEQLITLVGTAKGGKSLVELTMAMEALSAGWRALFMGFEMSNAEQEMRHDGMAAEINYRKIMEGRLTPVEWRDLSNAMHTWAKSGDFILSADISGGLTLSSVQAKLIQHRPDILFIDGVYMMDDEEGKQPKGTSSALTNITRGLKRMAQRHRIPIVGTTQALSWKVTSSKGLQADSIGYTSSFVQDSDVVLGVDHDDERPSVAVVKVLLNRMGGRGEFWINWDFETMNFTQIDDGPVMQGAGSF
jgi:replicative DNA helicase